MASLPPQVFSILSALIEAHCGIHYGVADAELLELKVAPRLVECGFDSYLDYYYFLRYDAAGAGELDSLVESLVVHETYFFREQQQLEALVAHYLEPQLARSGRRARVWCAAAATGEEPLTLAMMLAERGLLSRVDIIASDVSERALAHARAGNFNRRALRTAPQGYGRWLRVEGERAVVDPALVDAIEWRRVNLLVEADFATLGIFDAVLCRNVLIYFRENTVQSVVERMVRHLVSDGVLVVGVSESLLRAGTALRCEERGGAFFYERAGAGVS